MDDRVVDIQHKEVEAIEAHHHEINSQCAKPWCKSDDDTEREKASDSQYGPNRFNCHSRSEQRLNCEPENLLRQRVIKDAGRRAEGGSFYERPYQVSEAQESDSDPENVERQRVGRRRQTCAK